MTRIAFVIANVLDHIGVGKKLELHRKRPRFGVSARIVNGDLNVHVAEVAPMQTFDRVKHLGMRPAAIVEPALIIEAASINYKPIAIPRTDRIPEPSGIGDGRMRAAVGKDLPEEGKFLVEDEGKAGVLDDLGGHPNQHLVRDAVR